MSQILEFRKPMATKIEEAQEEPLLFTHTEFAKVEYAAAKLDIPITFPSELVTWPWQATATAADLGIHVTEEGDVRLHDDNLALIQREFKIRRVFNRIWNIAFAAGVFYVVIRVLGL